MWLQLDKSGAPPAGQPTFVRRRGRVSSVRFHLSICGEPAGVRRKVCELVGKRKEGKPAGKRREVRLLASRARWWTITVGLTTRPLTPASSSSDPFGLAMGSGAVVVTQVEAYEKEFAGMLFADTSLTFGAFLSVVVVLAESLRTDRGSDRWVDKSES